MLYLQSNEGTLRVLCDQVREAKIIRFSLVRTQLQVRIDNKSKISFKITKMLRQLRTKLLKGSFLIGSQN